METKNKYIARIYCPLDNSYVENLTNHISGSRIRLQRFLTISNPYTKVMTNYDGEKYFERFIDVISFNTGFAYSVLFDERWFVGEETGVFHGKKSLIGTKMLVLDNSYIYEVPNKLTSEKEKVLYPHVDLYGKVVEIISEPYIAKPLFENDEEIDIIKPEKEVFVTVSYKNKTYRVMLFEEGLNPIE